MPPQQGDALLDLVDDRFDLGSHWIDVHFSFGRVTPPGGAT
jgi:hypothetical protein